MKKISSCLPTNQMVPKENPACLWARPRLYNLHLSNRRSNESVYCSKRARNKSMISHENHETKNGKIKLQNKNGDQTDLKTKSCDRFGNGNENYENKK